MLGKYEAGPFSFSPGGTLGASTRDFDLATGANVERPRRPSKPLRRGVGWSPATRVPGVNSVAPRHGPDAPPPEGGRSTFDERLTATRFGRRVLALTDTMLDGADLTVPDAAGGQICRPAGEGLSSDVGVLDDLDARTPAKVSG